MTSREHERVPHQPKKRPRLFEGDDVAEGGVSRSTALIQVWVLPACVLLAAAVIGIVAVSNS